MRAIKVVKSARLQVLVLNLRLAQRAAKKSIAEGSSLGGRHTRSDVQPYDSKARVAASGQNMELL
jgi:hypothetical protein